MTRTLSALSLVTLSLTACAGQSTPEPKVAKTEAEPEAPPEDTEAAEDEAATDEADAAERSDAEAAFAEPTRKLGDYFVYRFGGSFTKHPVTLTEQVVAEDDGLLVVDLVLDAGRSMTALRVRMTPSEGQVVRVSRLGEKGEMPGTLADYDEMMQKTQFIPDSNDEVVGTDKSTCLVGTKEVACAVTTYLVSFGDRQAMMSVSTSNEIPGRDVGGEIIGPDGTTVYSARLIDQGNEKPEADALAQYDFKRFLPEGL